MPRPERAPTSVWCGCRRFAFEIHQGESLRETGKATVQRPLASVMRRIDDEMLAKGSCWLAKPASVRRLMLCSSCMQGNLHVQFFGGPAAER